MDTQDPAQPGLLHGERVQPDGPLSGEVKRGGSGPSRRYLKHLAALHANPKARRSGTGSEKKARQAKTGRAKC